MTKKAKSLCAWRGAVGHEIFDCQVVRVACPYLEKPMEAHPAKKAMKKAKAVGLTRRGTANCLCFILQVSSVLMLLMFLCAVVWMCVF